MQRSKPDIAPSIDDYANNMFRFERLHDGWIDDCARYLKHIFGDHIQGAVVVDYAFGRGNWSLAFLRAGASRVIAVDASASNVERLQNYCTQHNIHNIDIRCGNVLEQPMEEQADILWLYGIYPSISKQAEFTKAVLRMAKPDALVLAYGFDKYSLREFIVERARTSASYTDEQSFRADSLKFSPAGRMRARDDLTAPHVEWHTAEGLAKMFAPHGFYPVAQLQDFRTYIHGRSDAEFAPHHLLLSPKGNKVALKEPARPYSHDLEILSALWNGLLPHLEKDEQRSLAITAFNIHFDHLAADGNPQQSILQLYLLLFYGLMSKQVDAATLSPLAASLVNLGGKALANEPRNAQALADAFLTRYLQSHSIRI